jgi:hypothetical protein
MDQINQEDEKGQMEQNAITLHGSKTPTRNMTNEGVTLFLFSLLSLCPMRSAGCFAFEQ